MQVSGAASSRSFAARCRVSSTQPHSAGGDAVMGDAAAHFAVTRFGGGQIDDAPAGFRGAFFSQQALARTGAAEDQFFHGTNFR
jgi:hypothetical protein